MNDIARPTFAGLVLDTMRGFLLNVGYLLCVAMVVTAPAATTALVAASIRWRRDGEVPTTRAFLRDVRHRLVRDLPFGFVLLALVGVFALDLSIIGQMQGGRRVMLILWLSCAFVVALTIVAVPVVCAESARHSEPSGFTSIVRVSIVRAVRRPFRAICAVAVLFGAAALASISPVSLLLTPIIVASLSERLISRER